MPQGRQVVCGINCGLVLTQENPRDADLLADVRLFAVMATWMEADVVAATVKNALAQGCERVYLVDNGSQDDTVEVACAAGAILAERYATPHFDEHLRTVMLNATVARVSLEEGSDHIWWLYVDADEFPHGPHGLTLREYLERLDRQFRVVGSRVFNHYPAGTPQYLPGFHPLDFQPLCHEFVQPMCPVPHWKHPLQRYDRQGPFLVSSLGFHTVMAAPGTLLEPATPVLTHHFQYRDERVTRQRLTSFSRDPSTGASRGWLQESGLVVGKMHQRVRRLDAVYGQRWGEVEIDGANAPVGVHLRPWQELVDEDDTRVARWYADDDLHRAVRAFQGSTVVR